MEVVYFSWDNRITWHSREEFSYTQASCKYSLILILFLKLSHAMPDRIRRKVVIRAAKFVGGALLGCVKYISTQFQVKLVLCFVADA